MKIEIEGWDKQGPIRLHLAVDNQFAGQGEWLRGNLHCHVAQMGDPGEVCALYRERNFDFLAGTDYARITPMPEPTQDFITLPGAEMACAGGVNPHIVCYGLKENLRPTRSGAPDDIRRLLRDVEAQGGLAHLAHPHWSDFGWEEFLRVAQSGLTGFEVSNRLCWRINGKERSEELWQMLRNQGVRLAAVGVDDSHQLPGPSDVVTGRTWTGVLVRERTPEGVLEGIRQHRTYASEGPVIRSIRFKESGAIAVECTECVACHFRSRGFGVRSVIPDAPAEHFEVSLAENGYRVHEWVSIVLEDATGRRAWSSCIPVDTTLTPLY